MTIEPLLSVQNLVKHFPITRGVFGRTTGHVRAVDDVSFEIARGETLGLVGESGCGKTTVGRSVVRLIEPTSGRIAFEGMDLAALDRTRLRRLRRDIQIVFQDPMSSLNPRMRVADIVGESLEVHGIAKGESVDRRVEDIMRRVGLSPSWIHRYPHEFSGGQRQRIGIARAIALEPKLVVCDEAVSALDVSIQAQVINLLMSLRRDMNLSYLFIAHDLSVVRHISQRVAVMYLGQIVETAPTSRIFRSPAHPYTRALLSAIPVPDPKHTRRRMALPGDVPSPAQPPNGCRFHTRCPAVFERCRNEKPRLAIVREGHAVRCFHGYDLDESGDRDMQIAERIDRATRDNAVVRREAIEPIELPRQERPAAKVPRAQHASSETTKGRLGAAVCAVGLTLVALGHHWSGVLLALAAYAGFVRRRWAHVAHRDGILLGLLALCVVSSLGVSAWQRRALAREQLAGLKRELEARARATGGYPDTIGDLGWRLYSVFPNGKPVDPWKNRWVYRTPGTDGKAFDLRSLGPDRRPSADDIGDAR